MHIFVLPVAVSTFHQRINMSSHKKTLSKNRFKYHADHKLLNYRPINENNEKIVYRGFLPNATFGPWKKSH